MHVFEFNQDKRKIYKKLSNRLPLKLAGCQISATKFVKIKLRPTPALATTFTSHLMNKIKTTKQYYLATHPHSRRIVLLSRGTVLSKLKAIPLLAK